MAKKDKTNKIQWNPIRGLNDLRAGIDEDSKDIDRANIAKLARILGFVLVIAAVLFLISALKRFGAA